VDVHARYYDRTLIAAALEAWRLLFAEGGGEHSAAASRREFACVQTVCGIALKKRRVPGGSNDRFKYLFPCGRFC